MFYKLAVYSCNWFSFLIKGSLKIKATRSAVLTLTKGQVQSIYVACSNIQDISLIRVLYEGGLRIGEAISLWIEDLNIGPKLLQ